MDNDETSACTPQPLTQNGFNQNCILPYGLSIEHIEKAMHDHLDYLRLINQTVNSAGKLRLESLLMPANFSSMVGEYLNTMLPKYCLDLVKNQYPNGHPDLIPSNRFENNAVQHSSEGIEIKASLHSSRWQGHNAESVWLMVYVFDNNTSNDWIKKETP